MDFDQLLFCILLIQLIDIAIILISYIVIIVLKIFLVILLVIILGILLGILLLLFTKGIKKLINRNRNSGDQSSTQPSQIFDSFCTHNFTQPPQQTQPSIFTNLAELPLDASKCELSWSHDDLQDVGGTTVATIKFKNVNGNLYKLKPSDTFTCYVKHVATPTEVSYVVEPLPFAGHEELKVSFTVRLAGEYFIMFKTDSELIAGSKTDFKPIAGSPYIRRYLPGALDSEKTVFLQFNNTIVLIAGVYHSISIEPKDCFGNIAVINQAKLDIEIRENGPSGPLVNPELLAGKNSVSEYELYLKVEQVGCYVGQVKYNNQIVGPIILSTKDRQLIAATFYKYVLSNIGSEKFQDKQKYFYNEVCKLNKSSCKEQVIKVSRRTILEDTMRATKNYTFNDWSKKFVIEFKGEEGLDWGGVSREFFSILSDKCFDCSNGLFHRFKDDHQELVLPNQHQIANFSLKYYKFAGCLVGKCLYDSTVSNPLLVKARFARSFLAQIIGLKINYKYLESDDPELYKTKVCYIKNNDVTGLEQKFVEEEYTSATSEPKIIPLIPNGQNIEVTNENKIRYLNLLVEYRLCTRIKEEMDAFLEGLNSIIPDELLAIFDETELELLMCGTSVFKFEDFKSNTAINGAGASFNKVVSWFWAVVSDFTQEEMARLVQFTTGCSQLPPGGFKDLTPRFQITPAPKHGQLPTAHTCFNQLCLPDYDSCEQFQNCLMLAINEGSEGFGFA